MSTEQDFKVEQEPDYVRKAGTALVVFIAVTPMAIGVVVAGAIWIGYVAARKPDYSAPPPAGTVEQTLVESSLRGPDYDARKSKLLESWGWVDRGRGVARIPIDRAMSIVVERGQ